MRSFNANFITEKNKRADGPAPVNLLTFGFTTPVYLSDRDVTPSGGSAHSGLIKSWGFIDTSLTQTPGRGILGRIEISDLQLVIINSESSPFSANFTAADPPENVTVELYQWFDGLLDSEKELIFKGVIRGQPEYTLHECKLTVRGIWEKYNKMIGEDLIISADDYANADPDDIGKMRNLGWGDLTNVKCRALKAGAVDTLRDDLTSSATSFYVSLSSKANFPAGAVIVQIDAEQISGTYNQATGQFTSCTRGYNTTTAVAHDQGAAVAEILTEYIYEAFSHPIKSFGDIRVDGVKQTSGYTDYTGQTGDELAGYAGTAVIKFTTLPIIKRQVNIAANDNIGVSDTIAVNDGIGVTDNISIAVPGTEKDTNPNGNTSNNTNNPTNAYDGSDATYADVLSGGNLVLTFPATSYGTITSQEYYVKMQAAIGTISVLDEDGNDTMVPNSVAAGGITTYRFTSTRTGWNDGIKFQAQAGEQALIYEVYKKVTYSANTTKTGGATKTGSATKAGAASKTGTVTLTGNSVADTVIGKLIVCDAEAYRDDGSGTYTGTPNTLIERPDHVFKHVWGIILSAPSGDIDSTTFTAAGTFYNTNSYAFALLVNKPIRAADLLIKLALQCRSRFFVTPYGKAKLMVRQLSQGSGHAIAKNEIKRDSVSVKRSAFEDMINYFNIHHSKDHSVESNRPEDYCMSKKFSDATSISRYGQQEWKGREDVFLFDAVTLSAMVSHVGAFLLDYHKIVRKMPKFSVFLDNCEIEPGDIIDITHDLDSMSGFVAEVLKINHRLGSARRKMIDHMEIQTIEN